MSKVNKEDFLERARNVHGDKYNYDKVEYIDTKTKVIITCPKHGDFTQSPNKHMYRRGCPKCGMDRVKAIRRDSQETFIEKAKEVHGDTYDYSLVQYVNSRTYVDIICKEHGVFSQEAKMHTSGQGCPKCANKLNGLSCRKPQQQFLEEVRRVHGDKYDYSLTDYQGAHKDIEIICREHGVFKQRALSHLFGNGCPRCSTRTYKEGTEGVVYILKVVGYTDFTGYGVTQNFESRLSTHKRNLRRAGFFIEDYYCSDPMPIADFWFIENKLKSNFSLPMISVDVEGFRTESTDAFYEEVILFMNQEILKLNKEKQWQH